MLVMELIIDCHIQSIDFVLSFLQVPVKTDIYMKPPNIPKDFEIPDLPNFTDFFIYMYKIVKNLYGFKDYWNTWYEYLKRGLIKRGWHQLWIDEWVLTKNGVILVIYVNDAILISPSKQNINNEIISLMKDYNITD